MEKSRQPAHTSTESVRDVGKFSIFRRAKLRTINAAHHLQSRISWIYLYARLLIRRPISQEGDELIDWFMRALLPNLRKADEVPRREREKILSRWHKICYAWWRCSSYPEKNEELLLFLQYAHDSLYTSDLRLPPHPPLADALVSGGYTLLTEDAMSAYEAGIIALRLAPRKDSSPNSLKQRALGLIGLSCIEITRDFIRNEKIEEAVSFIAKTEEIIGPSDVLSGASSLVVQALVQKIDTYVYSPTFKVRRGVLLSFLNENYPHVIKEQFAQYYLTKVLMLLKESPDLVSFFEREIPDIPSKYRDEIANTLSQISNRLKSRPARFGHQTLDYPEFE